MKLFLVICLVICTVGVYCEDAPKPTKEFKEDDAHVKECADETKVDTKMLEQLQKDNEFPKTREMQCFMACMMKKEGMMNDDGTFTKQYTDSKVTEACRNTSGKDACETAYNTVECLLKNELILNMIKSE